MKKFDIWIYMISSNFVDPFYTSIIGIYFFYSSVCNYNTDTRVCAKDLQGSPNPEFPCTTTTRLKTPG